jgi:hypothetical protein
MNSPLLCAAKATPGLSPSKRHPLYRFVKDTGHRQTHGEGLTAFGAERHALSPADKKVEKSGS